MVGQLGVVNLRAALGQRLQRLAHLPVQPRPADQPELTVDGVSDQGVAEGVASDAYLTEDAGSHGLIEPLEELRWLQAHGLADHVGPELLAHDRGCLQDGLAFLGQAGQAQTYDATHALRNVEGQAGLWEAVQHPGRAGGG